MFRTADRHGRLLPAVHNRPYAARRSRYRIAKRDPARVSAGGAAGGYRQRIGAPRLRTEHYSRNPRVMRVLRTQSRLLEPPVFSATDSSVTVTLYNRNAVDVETDSGGTPPAGRRPPRRRCASTTRPARSHAGGEHQRATQSGARQRIASTHRQSRRLALRPRQPDRAARRRYPGCGTSNIAQARTSRAGGCGGQHSGTAIPRPLRPRGPRRGPCVRYGSICASASASAGFRVGGG